MRNYFMARGCYSTNDQMNAIMQAPSKDFKQIRDTIESISLDTEQYIMPFHQWATEYDPKIAVIGNTGPGEFIKSKIGEYNE